MYSQQSSEAATPKSKYPGLCTEVHIYIFFLRNFDHFWRTFGASLKTGLFGAAPKGQRLTLGPQTGFKKNNFFLRVSVRSTFFVSIFRFLLCHKNQQKSVPHFSSAFFFFYSVTKMLTKKNGPPLQ